MHARGSKSEAYYEICGGCSYGALIQGIELPGRCSFQRERTHICVSILIFTRVAILVVHVCYVP
jgi:hypothetical protein